MSTRPIPYLYPTHARSEFPNAPDYDPFKPIKNWIAESPATINPGDIATFHVFDENYNVVPLVMSVQESITFNFVGHHAYPPYSPAPFVGASFNGGPFPNVPVSTRVEAEALAVDLGLDASLITDFMDQFHGTFPITYNPADMRRAWLLNGVAVGTLLAEKYANGVGAPGHWSSQWDVTQPRPTWIADIPSNAAAPGAKVLGVPLGPIDADEKVVNLGLLGLVLQKPDALATSTGTGGGLLPDERAALLGMAATIKRVFGA